MRASCRDLDLGFRAVVSLRVGHGQTPIGRSPTERRRLMTTPGITGLWQIGGRAEIDFSRHNEHRREKETEGDGEQSTHNCRLRQSPEESSIRTNLSVLTPRWPFDWISTTAPRHSQEGQADAKEHGRGGLRHADDVVERGHLIAAAVESTLRKRSALINELES